MSKANDLRVIFSRLKGAEFISIDTETKVTLRGGKANPQQGRVTKLTMGSNVMVFSNKNSNGYANMVERRLVAEGKDPKSFELSPRKWGTREIGTPFVMHNGSMYLEVIFLRCGDVYYRLDGKEVPKSMIEGLPEKSDEAEQGGLEDKVIIRTYAVDSIVSLTVDKELYKL